MFRFSLLSAIAIAVFALGARELIAAPAGTYVVGTCKPKLASYSTISAALAATPAPAIVQVCPGTYPEQIVIKQPVTLEGISSDDQDVAIIAPPASGLQSGSADSFVGTPVAAQVWVQNVPGPVTISNITVTGSTDGISSCSVFGTGIFFQNTSGTLNHVLTAGQNFRQGCGIGILLDAGVTSSAVTVQNSSIVSFEQFGILVEPGITATIKGNVVDGQTIGAIGVFALPGSTYSIINNLVVNSATAAGIASAGGMPGSEISKNTIVGGSYGIASYDETPITSNQINGASTTGVLLISDSQIAPNFPPPIPVIQGNTITNTRNGIDLGCFDDTNVSSNAILDAGYGVANVPAGVTANNNTFNVALVQGACPQ